MSLGRVIVAVPGTRARIREAKRLLGLVGEPGFDLDQAIGRRREPLDGNRLVESTRTGGQLQRIGAVHRAVRPDVEKRASAQLGWAHVLEDRLDLVEIAVVVADQFAPAVQPVVKIVKR